MEQNKQSDGDRKNTHNNRATLAIRIAKKLPFVREFTTIANAYAYSGSHLAFTRVAPIKEIFSRILAKGAISFAIAKILMRYAHTYKIDISKIDAPTLNIGTFPTLLGFGIGIFALLFAIKPEFIIKLHESKEANGFDAQILNVDLAYPLIAMAGIVFINFLLKFFPSNNFTQTTSISSFIYGMAMIFEIIGFIFITAFSIISKSKNSRT